MINKKNPYIRDFIQICKLEKGAIDVVFHRDMQLKIIQIPSLKKLFLDNYNDSPIFVKSNFENENNSSCIKSEYESESEKEIESILKNS
ncbi:hypothetical protein U3516DRAFT_747241 [Neocallimastix sp. 'constans']